MYIYICICICMCMCVCVCACVLCVRAYVVCVASGPNFAYKNAPQNLFPPSVVKKMVKKGAMLTFFPTFARLVLSEFLIERIAAPRFVLYRTFVCQFRYFDPIFVVCWHPGSILNTLLLITFQHVPFFNRKWLELVTCEMLKALGTSFRQLLKQARRL